MQSLYAPFEKRGILVCTCCGSTILLVDELFSVLYLENHCLSFIKLDTLKPMIKKKMTPDEINVTVQGQNSREDIVCSMK